MGDAIDTAIATNQLHSLIDDIEGRIFGPAPREVASAAIEATPPNLAVSVSISLQRLRGANERLGALLDRINA